MSESFPAAVLRPVTIFNDTDQTSKGYYDMWIMACAYGLTATCMNYFTSTHINLTRGTNPGQFSLIAYGQDIPLKRKSSLCFFFA